MKVFRNSNKMSVSVRTLFKFCLKVPELPNNTGECW